MNELQMNAQCKRAIKILEQYDRLTRKLAIRLPLARLAQLDALRETGEIKSTDLPAKLRLDFPGEFAGMTLDVIRRTCNKR
jgi:hypothetical protein